METRGRRAKLQIYCSIEQAHWLRGRAQAHGRPISRELQELLAEAGAPEVVEARGAPVGSRLRRDSGVDTARDRRGAEIGSQARDPGQSGGQMTLQDRLEAAERRAAPA